MIIYIEFTKPKSPYKIISNVIRAVQRTPYSHVRIRWTNSLGLNIVYEASGSEVRFLGDLAQKAHKVIVLRSYEFNITESQYRDMLQLCMSYAGTKYGMLQIIGLAVANMFGLRKNPLTDRRQTQICSELVGRVLEEVMLIKSGRDLDMVGPKEIDKLLESKVDGYLIKLVDGLN